jgi:hypothetical protein
MSSAARCRRRVLDLRRFWQILTHTSRCVIRLLASQPGPVGCCEGCSSFSTSLLQPSRHVGEHQAGSAGWRALGGSGGIAGGATTTGGKGCGTLAQAASSKGSASSISFCAGRALGLLVDDFGDGLDTAGFFIACILGCFAGGSLKVALAHGPHAGHLGQFGLCA